MKKGIILMVAIFTFVIQAWGQDQAKEVTVITAEKASEILQKEKNLQLIDVRTEEEFQEGHLQTARNVCVTDAYFKENAEKLDKNKPIYVYCRSGNRSAKAANILAEMGFKEIYDIEGGMLNWESKGLTIEK